MKKVLMSMAVAVMTAFAFTACTGNSENSNNGSDSTAVEQTGETIDSAAAQAEIPIEELKELDCPAYHLNIADGWKASSRMVNNSCNIRKSGSPFTTVAFNTGYDTIDEFKQKCEKAGATKLDDVTLGDKTFALYFSVKDKEEQIDAATAYGDKIITVRAYNGAHQMDPAQAKEAIIANITTAIQNMTIK